MCGITGIINHPCSREQIERSLQALRHRGPDGSGIYMDPQENIGLGHTRLSVVDLVSGGQPLFAQGQDIVLVANGEIYDFEKIRTRLEERGHRFSTKSDSEVILYLYLEHGMDFFSHLRGEFAFLLYDRREKKLIAVRDRFGIKPLYYVKKNGGYLFSSEAKGLFATGFHSPQLDAAAVRDMLSFVPVDSIFTGVEALPPGHYMTIGLDGNAETVKYWDLDLPPGDAPSENQTFEKNVRIVREMVDEAVKLRLRADVPVGVYLSGGVDSAAVAATAAKFHPGKIKAFTVEFTGDQRFNEGSAARRMAEKIGAEFHAVPCDNETLLKNLEGSLWKSELPTQNLHGVGKYILSRLAGEHVKVVLTGEGADETFLGYEYFKREDFSIASQLEGGGRKTRKIKSGWGHVKRIMETLGFIPLPEIEKSLSPIRQHFLLKIMAERHRKSLRKTSPLNRLQKEMDPSQTEGRNRVKKVQYFSIKAILAPYILSILGDRQEMAHSVEGRTPLLDHYLFEAVRAIPDAHKIHHGVEKHIFREAMKDRITPEIYETRKWPFSAPVSWVERGRSPSMDRLMEKYLSRDTFAKAGLFNYGRFLWLRILQRMVFFDCEIRRDINSLFFFIMTVHILHHLYVRDFDVP